MLPIKEIIAVDADGDALRTARLNRSLISATVHTRKATAGSTLLPSLKRILDKANILENGHACTHNTRVSPNEAEVFSIARDHRAARAAAR